MQTYRDPSPYWHFRVHDFDVYDELGSPVFRTVGPPPSQTAKFSTQRSLDSSWLRHMLPSFASWLGPAPLCRSLLRNAR
jgi:hypothetical protein